jgi:hypothetical protein
LSYTLAIILSTRATEASPAAKVISVVVSETNRYGPRVLETPLAITALNEFTLATIAETVDRVAGLEPGNSPDLTTVVPFDAAKFPSSILWSARPVTPLARARTFTATITS